MAMLRQEGLRCMLWCRERKVEEGVRGWQSCMERGMVMKHDLTNEWILINGVSDRIWRYKRA